MRALSAAFVTVCLGSSLAGAADNATEWWFNFGSGTFTTSSGVTGNYVMAGGGSSGNSRKDTVIYDNGVITHEFEYLDSSDHDQRFDFDRTDGGKQIIGHRQSTSNRQKTVTGTDDPRRVVITASGSYDYEKVTDDTLGGGGTS